MDELIQAGILSPEDVDSKISDMQKELELTPDGDQDIPGYLFSLGFLLQFRFTYLGNIEDLNRAIVNYRKAMQIQPDGHPGWAALSRLSRRGTFSAP